MKKMYNSCFTFLLALAGIFIVFPAGAQCLEYQGGPYSDQGAIGNAAPEGGSVQAAYQCWLGEVYTSLVAPNGSYTLSLAAPGACAAAATDLTVIEGGAAASSDYANNGDPQQVTDGVVLASCTQCCSLDFTATAGGTVYFVISANGNCGANLNQTDNGTPTLLTISAAPAVCGDGVTGSGETYCTCPADVDCDAQAFYVGQNAQGLILTSDQSQMLIASGDQFPTTYTGVNPDAGYFFIGYTGPSCVPQTDTLDYSISSDFGNITNIVVNAPGDTAMVAITNGNHYTRFFLELTQADIEAAPDGLITITFSGDNGACVTTLPVQINTDPVIDCSEAAFGFSDFSACYGGDPQAVVTTVASPNGVETSSNGNEIVYQLFYDFAGDPTAADVNTFDEEVGGEGGLVGTLDFIPFTSEGCDPFTIEVSFVAKEKETGAWLRDASGAVCFQTVTYTEYPQAPEATETTGSCGTAASVVLLAVDGTECYAETGNVPDPAGSGDCNEPLNYSYTANAGSDCEAVISGTVAANCACVAPSGIAEAENMFTIANPVINTLIINSLSNTGKGTIALLDVNGKKLMEQSYNGQSAEIKVENLAAGAYFVKISALDQTVVKKIIKL